MSATLQHTPLDEIPRIRERLRAGFQSGKSRPIAYRKAQLLHLAYLVQDNIEKIQEALRLDLGRPVLESNFLELAPVINECLYAHKNVETWAKPGSVPLTMNSFALSPKVRKDPKGVALIIGPFNYPVWCTFMPLIGAISAGCGALLKLPELTPATSALFAELVPKYLDNDLYAVINGAIPETTKVLELQWDHIVFTGGSGVGKIVAAAAAKHLTPTTLELGGKSPVIIDTTCDFDVAAKRILWGKTANAGQTCIAPDYVLVLEECQDQFVQALEKAYASFYPTTEGGAVGSKSFSRIISTNHYNRIKGLLDRTQGKVVVGGQTDEANKFIAPTIVRDVPKGDSLLESEIFGPVLPIVAVKDIEAAIEYINERDHPLALYVFTKNATVRDEIFARTLSGMTAANDVLIQGGIDELPFGGVGPSGYGAHGGKHGFDTFTHQRGTIDAPSWIDKVLSIRFPPYTDKNLKVVNSTMVKKIPIPRPAPGQLVAMSSTSSS
jgi:aldehyde dehydrogenase (NAD+)/aldehyde dehydrogenase (NAD(P)+)